MLDFLLRFYNTLLNIKLFCYKLLTDQSIQQFQKKIRDLERINHDLNSNNHDLNSNNQILKHENMQLKDSLSKELSLWSSRQDLNIPVNADRASLLHRLETLDDIISDETRLHAATLQSSKEFGVILKQFEDAIKKSKDAPLFRNNEKRSDDPGNRCSLYPRHALLMYLLRLKDNPTQGTLEAFFGIDQSTVCRYLQFCNEMLKETLPTPDRISKAMSKCKTVKGIKEFVPGRGAGTLLVDGTHIRVDRPGEKEERKKTYTGKKKNHTNNTTIISTTDNIIVGISKTAVGSTHDLKMIKEHSIPFGRRTRKMRDKDTPAKEKFTMYMDLGYQGIQKYFPGVNVVLPHKKPRKKKTDSAAPKLTKEQKAYNKKVGGIRVTVENSIGRIKQYSRMTEPYGGTEEELNAEINIVAGLVNLHLMMTLQRGSASLRRRFLG